MSLESRHALEQTPDESSRASALARSCPTADALTPLPIIPICTHSRLLLTHEQNTVTHNTPRMRWHHSTSPLLGPTEDVSATRRRQNIEPHTRPPSHLSAQLESALTCCKILFLVLHHRSGYSHDVLCWCRRPCLDRDRPLSISDDRVARRACAARIARESSASRHRTGQASPGMEAS